MGAVNFPKVQFPPRPSGTPFIQVQRNFPGMLGRLNEVLARHAVNIAAQYYETDHDVGYVVLDADASAADGQRVFGGHPRAGRHHSRPASSTNTRIEPGKICGAPAAPQSSTYSAPRHLPVIGRAFARPRWLAMTLRELNANGINHNLEEAASVGSYDSRMSSSLRPSPFSSFLTALEATTSPSLA